MASKLKEKYKENLFVICHTDPTDSTDPIAHFFVRLLIRFS